MRTNPHSATYAATYTGMVPGQWLTISRREQARRTRERLAQDAAYARTIRRQETR